jgi:glutathione peroxidase
MKTKYRKLKKVLIVIVLLTIVFGGYVLIVNRNSVNMTGRQKLLKAVYPAFVWFNKLANKNAAVLSNEKVVPPVSFYSMDGVLNDGKELDLASLKGKKVLLVNTASDCGYTGQYDELEKLYSRYKDKLVVIAFPANDFKEQEKGTDKDIAQFCKQNYGISFPLMQKSTVIKSPAQNTIFRWLTDAAKNGWNNRPPSWNFSKYLVNEEGKLTNYFGPAVEPLSEEVIKAIDKN